MRPPRPGLTSGARGPAFFWDVGLAIALSETGFMQEGLTSVKQCEERIIGVFSGFALT